MEAEIKQPFTNLQLELLKVFFHELEDRELLELKKILAAFFAQRAINQANKIWDEQGWTDNDVEHMLATKMRSSPKK